MIKGTDITARRGMSIPIAIVVSRMAEAPTAEKAINATISGRSMTARGRCRNGLNETDRFGAGLSTVVCEETIGYPGTSCSKSTVGSCPTNATIDTNNSNQ
jgi:hypothetical protein